jgi:hypothetical protein
VGVGRGWGGGVVLCAGCVAPHGGVRVGRRGVVGRGGWCLQECAHAVQHLLEHVAQASKLAGDARKLLVNRGIPLLHVVQQI